MTADLFLITAYCAGTICGALGTTTYTGTQALAGYTAACDPDVLPLGSFFVVEGVHSRGNRGWRCEDVGSGIQGRHVDLYLGSLQEAGQFGRRLRRVRVLSTPARVADRLPWAGPGCPGEHPDEGGDSRSALRTAPSVLSRGQRPQARLESRHANRPMEPSPGSLFPLARAAFWVVCFCCWLVWFVALVRKGLQLVLNR